VETSLSAEDESTALELSLDEDDAPPSSLVAAASSGVLSHAVTIIITAANGTSHFIPNSLIRIGSLPQVKSGLLRGSNKARRP
jgi:hypothetical protein